MQKFLRIYMLRGFWTSSRYISILLHVCEPTTYARWYAALTVNVNASFWIVESEAEAIESQTKAVARSWPSSVAKKTRNTKEEDTAGVDICIQENIFILDKC